MSLSFVFFFARKTLMLRKSVPPISSLRRGAALLLRWALYAAVSYFYLFYISPPPPPPPPPLTTPVEKKQETMPFVFTANGSMLVSIVLRARGGEVGGRWIAVPSPVPASCSTVTIAWQINVLDAGAECGRQKSRAPWEIEAIKNDNGEKSAATGAFETMGTAKGLKALSFRNNCKLK